MSAAVAEAAASGQTHRLLTADSRENSVRAFGGAKGHKLFLLAEAGLAVPPWAIVPATASRRVLLDAGLLAAIDDLLAGAGASDLAAVAGRIEAMVLAVPIGDDVTSLIAAAHAWVGGGRVAVRSSAGDEDGAGLSFAGQYASFLNVGDADDLILKVRGCWASAYSARCLSYRASNGLPLRAEPIACIVQRMVDAGKSGVLFTANPLTDDPTEMVVSAVYGLGEGLVSGAVDADLHVLDHDDGSIRRTTLGDKRDRYVPAAAGGLVVRPTEPTLAGRACLLPNELAELHRAATAIEAVFGGPQDIEWSFDAAGRLAILQARPITGVRPVLDPTGAHRIWENSNIIESFGGLTAPMTFSFARDVYHEVFKEYCRILGVPASALPEMDTWLRNMLGYHNGRVYYNLLNWYKVLRLAPTYRINWRMLEYSIGAQESIGEASKQALEPLAALSPVPRRMVYAWIALRSFVFFFSIEATVRRFLKRFTALHRSYDALDYRCRSVGEIHAIFISLRRRFIVQFGRMILLEQMISLSVGALALLTRRWLPDAPPGFLLAMTRPLGFVESLEPVRRMTELSILVSDDPSLTRLVRETPPTQLDAALHRVPLPAAKRLLRAIEAYVADFGYRCVNEMKLEEPDMRDDPAVFFIMLQSALDQPRAAPTGGANDAADAFLRRRLRGPRRWVYTALRRKAQRLLAARERVRFCRTRVFGTARRMIRAIGAQLVDARVLDDVGDVFFLRIEELTGWFDGTVPAQELRPLVEMRRRHAEEHGRLEAPGRFETTGIVSTDKYAATGWRRSDETRTPAGPVGTTMTGTPCCPGSVTGTARLVTKPRDLGGGILVTYQTDPGWCPILPSASALLIERGSPLTHVAIVARELGIPTVIQIRNLTRTIVSGMTLAVDAGQGSIRVVDAPDVASSAESAAP